MRRIWPWLLVAVLAGCALTWPTVSVQDTGHAALPSQRREDQYVFHQDRRAARLYDREHDLPPPVIPPKKPLGTFWDGWLRGRSGYHDTLWVTVTVWFQAAFGRVVNRHAIPPPEGLMRPTGG